LFSERYHDNLNKNKLKSEDQQADQRKKNIH